MAFFILLKKIMLEVTTGSLCRNEFHPHWRELVDLIASLLAMSRESYLGQETTQPCHQVGLEGNGRTTLTFCCLACCI